MRNYLVVIPNELMREGRTPRIWASPESGRSAKLTTCGLMISES